MSRVAGKVVVVTGASSGIGEALALALGARGAQLVLAARREDRLERLAGRLGGGALPVRCDVASEADLDALVERTAEAFGRCDVLVNNAGIPGGGRFEELEAEQIERVLAVNLLAVVRLTKRFLPMLLESRGHVVNIASLAGRFAVPGASVYAASKHAVVGFSESLHHELAPRGVMVTVVNPGFVVTEGFPATELKLDARLRRLIVPLPRVVRTIAGAIERRQGPEVSVPRWQSALQAFRLLTPGLYRAGMGRIAARRAASYDAD